MRISRNWLREWLPALDMDARRLGERLTMAGLELDAIESAAPPCSGVVVGRVLTVEPHPQADRLKVCRVDDGSGKILQVVCGAPNVAPGILAPFARIGAELPNEVKIRRARLRGVDSQGMLCSAAELGLAESSEGLLTLPQDAPPGQDIRAYLDLDDEIMEIDLTPNRADCLSMQGVAREASLLAATPWVPLSVKETQIGHEDVLPVQLEAPDACPRYAGRIIRGLNPQASTPLWMRERLRRAGVRSISPAVDVTNYVMLELGQPMHAFDLDKLEREIRVRKARSGERLTLIDGQTVEVAPGTLLICDANGPLAVAGIMGGAQSAVSPATTNIFLESAFFTPTAISGRARSLGLHTESSHRFERGVDPKLQRTALERATQLLLEIAGGAAGPVVDVCSQAHLPATATISLRRERIFRLLGIIVPDEEVERILQGIGCVVRATPSGWEVQAPSYRFDLAIEADLIEELARVHGYDQVPERRPSGIARIGASRESDVPLPRLREVLRACGYQEVITFSFIDEAHARLFAPDEPPLRLANPLSSELAVMRPSLWPGLVSTLNYNRKRQQDRARVFESGLKFLTRESEISQIPTLAGAAFGTHAPEQWGLASRALDLFDVKGDVENLFARAGVQPRFCAAEHPALHPGQAARILVEDRSVGWLGMLHPEIERQLGFDQPVGLFEIDLSALGAGRAPYFQPLSRYPALRRDLALIVPEDVPAGQVLEAIQAVAGEHVRAIHLFDVYTGDGVEKGYKSLAFGLIYQGLSRNLTDREVESSLQGIIEEMERAFGARLRG